MPVPIDPEWVNEVERKLLKAKIPAKFVPQLATEWGVSKRTVWRYVSRARKRLEKRAAKCNVGAEREVVKAMLLESFKLAKEGDEKGLPDVRAMIQAARFYGDVTGATQKTLDLTSGGKAIGQLNIFMPAEKPL